MVIGRCSTGAYYLCDHYGHSLSRAVIANHLVKFHEKLLYQSNKEAIAFDVNELVVLH